MTPLTANRQTPSSKNADHVQHPNQLTGLSVCYSRRLSQRLAVGPALVVPVVRQLDPRHPLTATLGGMGLTVPPVSLPTVADWAHSATLAQACAHLPLIDGLFARVDWTVTLYPDGMNRSLLQVNLRFEVDEQADAQLVKSWPTLIAALGSETRQLLSSVTRLTEQARSYASQTENRPSADQSASTEPSPATVAGSIPTTKKDQS